MVPLSGTKVVRDACQSLVFLGGSRQQSLSNSRQFTQNLTHQCVRFAMPFVRPYGKGQFRCEVQKLGVRESKVFATKAEARKWGYQREEEIAAEKTGRGVTFGQVADRYLRDESPKKKDAVAWETRRMGYFKAHFGEKTPILGITRKHVAQWRDKRLETVSGSTVNREANLLSALFRKARIDWEYMQTNPMETVKMPKEAAPRTVLWNWRQIRAVLRYCQASHGIKTQQCGIAFHIALHTGMRLKEVLIAKRVGNIIVIDDSKTTEKGERVEIPTTSQGRRVMDRYGAVPWQIEPNEASVLFHKASLACGVRKPKVDGPTFHDSRGTALTHMARLMPVEQLKRISRHRDINTLVDAYYRETNEQIASRL
jgi:integrase